MTDTELKLIAAAAIIGDPVETAPAEFVIEEVEDLVVETPEENESTENESVVIETELEEVHNNETLNETIIVIEEITFK